MPWVPPPCRPLFADFAAAWAEEFWFGVRHHEVFCAAAGVGGGRGAGAAAAVAGALAGGAGLLSQRQQQGSSDCAGGSGSSSSGGGSSSTSSTTTTTTSSGFASPAAASFSAGAGSAAPLSAPDAASPAPHFVPALATIPLLSPRAALVLLLRRVYEARHAGGFERVCPPPHPALAARYRAISEFVPASLRETPAFARRRLEATRRRAEAERGVGGGGGVGGRK